MALDFAGLKAAVVAISPAQISDEDAADCVNRAYQTLLSSRPGGGAWFGLKRTSTLVTPADKTAGTLSLVQGSADVVGVGTAWATSDANRFLVVGGRVPLRIFSVTDATHLTLSQAWGEASLAGTPYQIMSLRHQLPTNAERVLRLVGPTWPLARRNLNLFDQWDPLRQQRGDPLIFAEAELLSANSTAASLPSITEGAAVVSAGATSVAVRPGRTATGFTVDFGVAAPPGATLDWVVFVPGAVQGSAVIATVIEIEMLPVPIVPTTMMLEYKLRAEDLVNDTDVPLLSPPYVMHGSRAEACALLFGRTGDGAWQARAQMDVAAAQSILDSLIREDRRMRGSHPVAFDSDDLSDPYSASWWQAWRQFNTLASGAIA